MYELEILDTFWKNYKKLIKGSSLLVKQVEKTLWQISQDPFYPSLKTHKVDTRKYDDVYSSRVNGDVRIAWSFNYLFVSNTLLLAAEGRQTLFRVQGLVWGLIGAGAPRSGDSLGIPSF